ncbi:MAG: glycosyltransferase family 39 protein [Mariprofundaceae bacterium]
MNKEKYNYPAYLSAMALSGIILLGFVLRLNGIDWGLPNVLHPNYSYHPDEWYYLTWTEPLAQGPVQAKHFIYGGTFYFSTIELIQALGHFITAQWGGLELRNITEVGRAFGVVYGVLTIFLTYLIGKLLFGRKVGLLAALFLAVYPGQIFWAQRIRPDELFSFLFTLNFLVMARIYKGVGNIHRNVVMGGLLFGLSVATRFPAVALYAGYAVAIFLPAYQGRFEVKQFLMSRLHWLLIAFTCIGYMVASPYSVIYPGELLEGIQIQLAYQSRPFADAIGRGPSWYQYGGRMLGQAMGYPLYALALAGVALAAWKRGREDLLLFAMIVPYFISLSLASWVVVRYTLPLLPILAVFSARLLCSLAAVKERRIALTSILGVAMLWTMAVNLAYARAITGEDARDTAAIWMNQQVRPGARIGSFIDYVGDKFKNPPPSRMHRWAYFSMRQEGLSGFLERNFDYLVINDRFIREGKRLGNLHPYPGFTQLQRWMEKHPGYELVKEFSRGAVIAGIDFGYQFTSIDYMLARPKIYIFQRLP